MKFPFIYFPKSNSLYYKELESAALRVVNSGNYIGGEEVESLERQLCALIGVKNAIATSNGLDALRLIFRAYKELGQLKDGDEVLVSSNTFIASFLAITDAGFVPVPVDADYSTMNMDSTLLENLLTDKSKAILTVHLYGRVSYDSNLRDFAKKHKLLVIEDSAQAIGAQVAMPEGLLNAGAIGDAAAFSFYPTKNIGALGDAGAITTNDDVLANTIRKLANYGGDRPYHYSLTGFNCRMDSIQAAFLKVKLEYIAYETEHRRKIAAIYNDCITNPCITKPLISNPDYCVWHQYTIRTKSRDSLRNYLTENGVGTNIVYPIPPHMQECYIGKFKHQLITESICATVLSLPVSTATSEDDARAISQIINRFEK